MTSQPHATIATSIKAAGSAERAKHEKKYLKSDRTHWGCAFGQIDKIAKAQARDLDVDALYALADELWRSNVFDLMVAAAGILALKRKIPIDERLWTVIDGYLDDATNWAEADRLARAAHRCVQADPTASLNRMAAWTTSTNLWRKRAALVFALPLTKPNQNRSRIFSWMAEHYVTDPEWFIQKAIGWWLRTLAPNDPAQVIEFLITHWPKLKGVARREATRRLSESAKTELNTRLPPEMGFKA